MAIRQAQTRVGRLTHSLRSCCIDLGIRSAFLAPESPEEPNPAARAAGMIDTLRVAYGRLLGLVSIVLCAVAVLRGPADEQIVHLVLPGSR